MIYTLQILLKLCHPIIPYITEEIWKEMKERNYTDDNILMNSKFPSQQKIFKDENIKEEVLLMKDFINLIRKARSDLSIHPKIELDIFCIYEGESIDKCLNNNIIIIKKLCKLKNVLLKDDSYNIDECITITLKNIKIFIPIKNIIDIKSEIKRLQKSLSNLEINLEKIEAKLNNKNFIEKAPSDIIQSNFNKKDYISKEIASIKELLATLSD